VRKALFTLALVALAQPCVVAAKAPVTQSTAPAHERFVVVDGGRNFRDVGGYRTRDGRTVRWGVLYRSGSMGRLTPTGQQTVVSLHPAGIIDLRSSTERASDNAWVAAMPGYWARSYEMSLGDMARAFGSPAGREPAAIHAMMNSAYRKLPTEQAASYRELFARLLAGKGPLIVNCTAGKDRTGVASALVLTALGVPYATVRRDFLLSNGAPGMNTLSTALAGPLATLPPESARLLAGVDGSYLDTAFAQIRADYGSVNGYLSRELGVGPTELAALRRNMLVRPGKR